MHLHRSAAFPLLVVAFGLLAPAAGLAQTEVEEALRKRIEELEAKLERLEERLNRQERQADGPSESTRTADAADPPAPSAQPAAQPAPAASSSPPLAAVPNAALVYAGSDGVGIRTPDNAFNLRFRALVQADSRWFLSDEQPGDQADQFVMRRVRPFIDARLYERLGLRITPEFAGSNFEILDAYLEGNLNPALNLRVGKFKPPVSAEMNLAPWDILMMERGFPQQLAPNRDIGAMLFGSLARGSVSYQAGIFNGTVDGRSADSDSSDEKELAARIQALPFKDARSEALRGLNVGFAFTVGTQEGSVANAQLPRFQTAPRNVFFTYAGGAYADGDRTRLVPQVYYSLGSFGLFGEYNRSEQEITRAGSRRDVANTGWNLTASYLLTGEKASVTGISPNRPFDWGAGAWGAFEVVGRITELDIDDDVFAGSSAVRLADPSSAPTKATGLGLGLNWYLNRSYRVMLNYEQTRFDGGAPGGGDREDERAIMTRFQVIM